MKGLVYILLIMPLCFNAQDKLFFKSGKTANGTLVSLSTKQVFFLYKDSIETSIIDKKEVLLIEKTNGERFLIGPEKNKPAFSNADSSDTKVARHAFGIQPFGVFAGRITIAYEHFFSSNKFGVSIPLSLTFDPFGIFYTSAADTSADSPEHIPGIGFITGIDLNYYFNARAGSCFFMGPRIRYGTDKMLRGIEGFSIQYQLGIHVQSGKNLSQHFSIGYGCVKILNVPVSSTLNPEQLYGWLSVNYRISLLK
jgi:hypothetical protein